MKLQPRLYYWRVNTAVDSGPTYYLVIENGVPSARDAIINDEGICKKHHVEEIENALPQILHIGVPMSI